ncbi:MAG: PDC sensor domain-containing protein [Candidatus Krumholzibacteriia bacterium]
MRKPVNLCVTALLAAALSAGFALGEEAPQKVKDLATGELAALGADPTIVDAVLAANAAGTTLDQIKAKDEEWQKTPGIADYMQALMDSPCAKYLLKLQGERPYLAEVFVMDNQGANVAMTDKTSDYWQGDEAKWQKSFNEGAGSVHISEVKFDDSTQAYLVQVSVPVMAGGKAVGAVTFGIDVDQVQ